MKNKTTLKIKNFGPLNNVDINISRINIVGGHNATGKSTASKLLYCMLKANSQKRKDFAFESIRNTIINLTNHIANDYKYLLELKNMSIIDLLKEFEERKDEYYQNKNYSYNKFFEREVAQIDELVKIINEDGKELYLSILRNLMSSEFLTKNFNGNVCLNGISDNQKFNFSFNLNEDDFEDDRAFESQGFMNIYDVFLHGFIFNF